MFWRPGNVHRRREARCFQTPRNLAHFRPFIAAIAARKRTVPELPLLEKRIYLTVYFPVFIFCKASPSLLPNLGWVKKKKYAKQKSIPLKPTKNAPTTIILEKWQGMWNKHWHTPEILLPVLDPGESGARWRRQKPRIERTCSMSGNHKDIYDKPQTGTAPCWRTRSQRRTAHL